MFLPRSEARDAIRKRLERLNRGDEVADALERFDSAGLDTPVEAGDSMFTHREVGGFQPTLGGEFVSDVFPSLIAFHFMGITMGAAVYDSQLDDLREAIRAGKHSSPWHVAERYIGRVYRPEHLVGFSQTEPYVIVRVQLFGWDVWRVHFPGVASKTAPHGILLDLKNQHVQEAQPDRPANVSQPPAPSE